MKDEETTRPRVSLLGVDLRDGGCVHSSVSKLGVFSNIFFLLPVCWGSDICFHVRSGSYCG